MYLWNSWVKADLIKLFSKWWDQKWKKKIFGDTFFNFTTYLGFHVRLCVWSTIWPPSHQAISNLSKDFDFMGQARPNWIACNVIVKKINLAPFSSPFPKVEIIWCRISEVQRAKSTESSLRWKSVKINCILKLLHSFKKWSHNFILISFRVICVVGLVYPAKNTSTWSATRSAPIVGQASGLMKIEPAAMNYQPKWVTHILSSLP